MTHLGYFINDTHYVISNQQFEAKIVSSFFKKTFRLPLFEISIVSRLFDNS